MPRIGEGLLGVMLGVCVAPLASAAESAPKPGELSGPTYALEWAIDLPLVVIPGFASLGWLLSAESPPAHCAPLCDRARVNAFDRGLAGNFSKSWATVSDVSLAVGLVAATTFVMVDEGVEHGLNDLVVGLESVLMANATSVLLNLATRRPRPLLYGTKAPEDVRNSPRASLSFFSGHVSMTAAVSTWAFTTTYRRGASRALPWIVLAAGTLVTTAVSLGRVGSGRHFPTDALAGAAVGISYGFLVPALHRSGLLLTPSVGAGGVGAVARVVF